ncbi:hypothetical protein TNCV_2844681 [Trichonephila clavipes]|nr:hypothetical protein TNCV_2844681 [Trichonephila clavipes]
MINEPVNPHHAVTFGECNGFCVNSRGLEVAQVTVMVVNVTMKQEMSFICPQDVKNPGGILFRFREIRKCFPLCGICWQKFMAQLQFVGTARGGFDEEYCGQMMVVVSPIVWQLQ